MQSTQRIMTEIKFSSFDEIQQYLNDVPTDFIDVYDYCNDEYFARRVYTKDELDEMEEVYENEYDDKFFIVNLYGEFIPLSEFDYERLRIVVFE